MWLSLAHPATAALKCSDCIEFLYDAKGVCLTKPANSSDPDHRIKRPLGTSPPCHTCPKIPAGRPPVPASAVELDEAGRRCLSHYRRCRAVNWQVPDATDPLVQQHAAVIRDVEQLIERRDSIDQMMSLGRIIRGDGNG